jgi:uncharacterized protein YydD (DUF2326 family)
MRLPHLTCNHNSFHDLSFNREGLTLIVGDAAEGEPDEGSSNGVGKTLALGLVHHCLGANVDARLKKAVPDWLFSLTFEVDDKEHVIERTGDGKRITFDGSDVSLTALRTWLDGSGAFFLDAKVPGLSFRSLIKRFARYRRQDCIDPLHTDREQDYDGRLRSLYLLGLDVGLAVSKRNHKIELDDIARSLKSWQEDHLLREIFRAGAQPKVRAEWLDREIARLKVDLEAFQVAEDYRAVELEAGELTKKLRETEKRLAVLQFQRDSIERSLVQQPDISKANLLELYDGLQSIFRPETLAHFDAVEEFHRSLAANRRARLEGDRARLVAEAGRIEADRQQVALQRDQKLQSLQGKRALDEYASLARHVAGLEEEHAKLTEFLAFTATLKGKAQQVREQRIEEDRVAADYVASEPAAEIDKYFSALAGQLYPQLPSGIVLAHNVGENQVRYDLTVQIEGDDSDGINAARIVCFDWTVLMHGANHRVDFIWHDNRLFAHLDPHVRAIWMRHILTSLQSMPKQYIATINTENFDAMKQFLGVEERLALDTAVQVVLRGDKPENKLLGVQFGR